MLKRLIDIALASAGLIITAPLLLVAAALIKLTSPGPVLFRQSRVGLRFQPFEILKLRTMVQDASATGGALTVDQDPRVTRVGWWLRMAKVDELPQLINVLRGEMSIVGPRPEVSEYVDLFRDDYERVLSVRPGVTDLASIRFRDEERVLAASPQPTVAYVSQILPLKIQLAKDYIERQSIRLDLAIIVRTIAYVFLRGGGREPASTAQSTVAHRVKRTAAIIVQLLVVAFANYWAFHLRFEDIVPDWASATMIRSLPWLIAIRGLAFVPFRLHQGLWRFFGVYDTLALCGAVATSSVVWLVFTQVAYGPGLYPRSIVFIDAFLVTVLLAGLRITARVYAEFMQLPAPGRRVIIYGAGSAGEQLVREMRQNPTRGYRPVGFLDDDVKKHGQRIHGIPVLGGRADLPRVIHRFRPSEILIAMPSADKSTLEPIVRLAEKFEVPVDVVPRLGTVAKSRLDVRELWKAVVERLGRCAAAQPSFSTTEFFRNQTVLVAGGGSVGSELCRQLLHFSPTSIVVLDRHEGTLRRIAEEARERSHRVPVIPVVGDINDAVLMDALLKRHRPKALFHAAGFQGSSLVTRSPLELVRTYVTGTRVLAHAAAKNGVDRVVLISEPEGAADVVLNAARRAAEILVTASGSHATTCCTLMFEAAVDFTEDTWFRFGEHVCRTGLVRGTPAGGPFSAPLSEAVGLCLNKVVAVEGGGTYLIESGRSITVEEIVKAANAVVGINRGHEPEAKGDPVPGPRRQDEPVIRRRFATQQPGWLTQVASLEHAAGAGSRATTLAAEALLLATQIEDVTPAGEENVLTLPNGEPAPVRRFSHCPNCGGHTARRVRTRNWRERLRKTLTSTRPFRCDECYWQGWLEPIIVEMPVQALESTEIVLSDLDRTTGIRDMPLKPGASKSH